MDNFEIKEQGFSDDSEDIKMFTIEVYKKDKRTKNGKRLINKFDLQAVSLKHAQDTYISKFPAVKGFICLTFETYVMRKNLLSGKEYKERYDTPSYCSPSSESYWSM